MYTIINYLQCISNSS